MVGKKNIVFGFLFLVITASLGPYMVTNYGTWTKSYTDKQGIVGKLQELKANEYEMDLEPVDPGKHARLNTDSILILNQLINAETEIDMIKGGPHAHGNLEALLNIAVGVVLCFLACGRLIKQAISWMFILGTLMHSGLLFFERVFQHEWAGTLLQTGIGPVLILLGLLLTGIMAALSLQEQPLRD
ncbi:MAG: hypothetical protein OEZ43_03290 [Gammaproteobacteria bacterium]|nr:hypothetical protein [Gammaproteobacteria bacterium]